MLSGEFSLFLHYETSPYLTKNDAVKLMTVKDLEGYVKRRERFTGIFQKACPESLAMGGKWNQIAKANLSFENLSVEECRRKLADRLTEIAPVVDRCLQEMDDDNLGDCV